MWEARWRGREPKARRRSQGLKPRAGGLRPRIPVNGTMTRLRGLAQCRAEARGFLRCGSVWGGSSVGCAVNCVLLVGEDGDLVMGAMVALVRRIFGGRRAGSSMLTAQLLDALARPGCPICRVIAA